MRYLILVCSLALAMVACIKEKSIDTGATPNDPVDSVDTIDPVPPPDTCNLVKFIQGDNLGDDTIFVLHYNNQDRLIKVIHSSDNSTDVDSFMYTYNSAGLVSKIHHESQGPMDIYYSYSGNKLIKRKVEDLYRDGDSTVYTYEYGSGNKPIRRNFYSYNGSSPVPGGFVGYSEYEYDVNGNITTVNNFGGGFGQYKKAIFTYLPRKNSFKPMAHISEALNVIDLHNGAFEEMVWNEQDLYNGVFLDQNGNIVKELHMAYMLDADDRVTKIFSDRTVPGSTNINTYTYRTFYQCR